MSPGGAGSPLKTNEEPITELVVFIAVLVALAARSESFGTDSRNTLSSHEAEIGALGFTREQRVPMPPEHRMRSYPERVLEMLVAYLLAVIL